MQSRVQTIVAINTDSKEPALSFDEDAFALDKAFLSICPTELTGVLLNRNRLQQEPPTRTGCARVLAPAKDRARANAPAVCI